MATALSTALQTGTAILSDPYLPAVVRHVVRLQQLSAPSKPGAFVEPGIGLRYAEPALAAFVKFRESPALFALGAIAVVGGIYALGYYAGKGKK